MLLKFLSRWPLVLLALLPAPAFAFDSYRYLHVTIDTIWYIFIFLLLILMVPFILMAVLYWWTLRHPESEKGAQEQVNPEAEQR
ncbi:MAG: hypothetical protein LBV36_06770 [Chromatiales bacterium]|nr:hypothetical protein [Chromatiales bacterium]